MPSWEIRGPDDYAFTPQELADIGEAVQRFAEALPCRHNVITLSNVGVFEPRVIAEAALAPADWPGQPVPKEPPF